MRLHTISNMYPEGTGLHTLFGIRNTIFSRAPKDTIGQQLVQSSIYNFIQVLRLTNHLYHLPTIRVSYYEG